MRPELVAKYRAQRVPRYTSYPPSPHFTPDVDSAAYADWLAELKPDTTLSLYLHVPFCRSMCWYCGCHTTVVPHDGPVKSYLAHLAMEAETVAALMPAGPRVTHLHFGGGTPTLMPPGEFVRLMTTLRKVYSFAPDAECAVEIDPRTLTDCMPTALAAGGINRASLGVQSFDPRVQQAINRIQTPERTAEAVAALRRAGIRAINFDLLYGLPHQTVESCVETVRTALAMNPDRLSVFGYAHMPGFKAHQNRIDESTLPDADARMAQNQGIEETLLAEGYIRIGLDHFARPDDPIASAASQGRLRRNFQGYTTDDADALIGLGASAIGRLPQGFVANIVPVPGYQKAVAAGGLAVGRGFRLSAEDRLRSDVIEQLMCNFTVDVADYGVRHPAGLSGLLPKAESLAELERDGLIRLDGTRLTVPDEAKPLVRSVAALFDSYLDPESGRHSKAI
ncbi:oxygen-independent coproporphyrinogen III oxidase [Indioceanicola profundi]|uniref:oxygen-independent coproporphyrinogen III oxidase n=1 Tax=Indioceanicola profundi TaxID=2220096 RepID=UPI000E6ADA3D|nr:oxygen-independent coproporphyrinogen III oxidase [Indioceanicola profundi]